MNKITNKTRLFVEPILLFDPPCWGKCNGYPCCDKDYHCELCGMQVGTPP